MGRVAGKGFGSSTERTVVGQEREVDYVGSYGFGKIVRLRMRWRGSGRGRHAGRAAQRLTSARACRESAQGQKGHSQARGL